MPIEKELLLAKEQAEKEYQTAADLPRNAAGRIIGIGIGPKITADEPQHDKTCLRFFVERKIEHKENIPKPFRIEKKYQGVQTDVIATGRIVSFTAGPGSSIGFDESDLPPNVDPAVSGTLGAVVAFGDSHYVLGSNHAMAVNGRATGAQIVFRPRDRLINDPKAYIFASITDHVHLTHDVAQDGPNIVDCALAEIINKSPDFIRAEFPHRIVTSGEGIDPYKAERVVRVDEIETPKGRIVSVGTRPRFDYSFGSFDFEDLVLIEGDDNESNIPFARPGDSGGLVAGFDEESQEFRATAIVMGGSRRRLRNGRWKSYTVACSFNAAIAALQKEVVKRLGSGTLTFDPNKPDDPHNGELRLVFSLPPAETPRPAASSLTSVTPCRELRTVEA